MALTSGTRLGAYEILGPLGAGGMGEVWRARDSRLGREVAIKVLPAEVTADADRLARFRREAQVLASLNHPHIAAIHGLEEVDRQPFLVLELAEGEDLAARLRRGALPLEEALTIARQVAEAVEAAHERGVVHRDLKPSNIKVSAGGSVKLLDFGLAKALEGEAAREDEPAVSQSPTLSRRMTEAGLILGTAAYMSPEQARGKPVDRRADVWAFGVVLFEMLTGRRLFAGETTSDVLAAVLKSDPDWSALPVATPPAIRRLLRRCLERDPRGRLHDIGDARLEIEDALAPAGRIEAPTPKGLSRGKKALWAASVLLAAITGTRLVSPPAPNRPPVRRFEVVVPNLATDTGRAPALSPDGRRILYLAGQTLWVRDLDRTEPRALITGGSVVFPFWSPDGSQIAYLSGGKLWKVPAAGGTPIVVASAGFNRGARTPGGAWLEDGRIVFAPAATGSALLAVGAAGGDFTVLHERNQDSEGDFHSPSALPRDRGVLFVVDRKNDGADTIAVLADGKRREVFRLEREFLDTPVYSPSGHIVYWRRSGTQGVWAFPFSLEDLERTGEPFLIAPDTGWPSVSADGTLLLAPQPLGAFRPAWVDRHGKVEEMLGEPHGPRGYRVPALSPDGRRIAVLRDEGHRFGLYVGSVSGGPLARVAFAHSDFGLGLAWHPRGDRLFFAFGEASVSDATSGIAVCAADGSGGERTIVPGGRQPEVTGDGRQLVFTRIGEGTGYDIYRLALGPDGLPAPGAQEEPLLVAPYNQQSPRVSPDGRFLAYRASDAREDEIYIRTFPRGAGLWQVSNGGGWRPAWSRDGSRLYWQAEEELWEAEIRTAGGVSVGAPRRLIRGDDVGLRFFFGFSVSSDDKRFLALRAVKDEKAPPPALLVVENWFEDYRKKGVP